MRLLLLASVIVLAPAIARADDACTVAANKAMDATVGATITLATATKYMTTHDDWCDGNTQALEDQDGAAVDSAWSSAINAQGVCSQNDQAQIQMGKLIVSLHNRRVKINDQLAALRAKCS